jgi:hypothetical protein
MSTVIVGTVSEARRNILRAALMSSDGATVLKVNRKGKLADCTLRMIMAPGNSSVHAIVRSGGTFSRAKEVLMKNVTAVIQGQQVCSLRAPPSRMPIPLLTLFAFFCTGRCLYRPRHFLACVSRDSL